jgi:hypothetical protein
MLGHRSTYRLCKLSYVIGIDLSNGKISYMRGCHMR